MFFCKASLLREVAAKPSEGYAFYTLHVLSHCTARIVCVIAKFAAVTANSALVIASKARQSRLWEWW